MLWSAVAVALVATMVVVAPAAEAQDVWYDCPDGFQIGTDRGTCEAPPNEVRTYKAPTCPSGGQLTPDRTACFYTIVPDRPERVPFCRAGSHVSLAGDRCLRPGDVVVTLDTPRCVDPTGVQDGLPTPDGRFCVTRTVPSAAMGEDYFVLAALIEPAVPGVAISAFPACATGFTQISEDLCQSEVLVPDTMQPSVEVGRPSILTCATGELITTTCAQSAPNAAQLAVYVPATAFTSATCNGIPVDYADPSRCVSLSNILVHSPAIEIEPPSSLGCPEGFTLERAGIFCARDEGVAQVTQPARSITPEGVATCPSGWSGPSQQLQCTEDVVVPELVDRCLFGNLWSAPSFGSGSELPSTCVLGHLPTVAVVSQALDCGADEPAGDGLHCVTGQIGLGCRPTQVLDGNSCTRRPEAAACPGGIRRDISPAEAPGTSVICVLATSVAGGAWEQFSSTTACLAGVLDSATGKCVTPTIPFAQPPTCFGFAITVDIGAGEMPTDGDDVILGTFGPDVIAAGAGDDMICGLGGDDRIWGQDGDDVIVSLTGNNVLRGGDGNDSLVAGDGVDNLNGGRGDDYVYAGDGDDLVVRGGTGNDLVIAAAGNDALVAGNGGIDVVVGGTGNDKVTGGPRGDVLWGGEGSDELKGNGGNDRLFGQAATGTSELRGGPGRDVLLGGPGAICNGGNTAVAAGAPSAEYDWADGCDSVINVP